MLEPLPKETQEKLDLKATQLRKKNFKHTHTHKGRVGRITTTTRIARMLQLHTQFVVVEIGTQY